MSTPNEDLVRAVSAARDQAKRLLTAFEQQGHPETSRSSALYLALVALRKRLMKEAPVPSAVVTELEQLLSLCEGKLARIKPELDDALKVARGTASGS
jgi:superfamily II DNA helicase RecQ